MHLGPTDLRCCNWTRPIYGRTQKKNHSSPRLHQSMEGSRHETNIWFETNKELPIFLTSLLFGPRSPFWAASCPSKRLFFLKIFILRSTNTLLYTAHQGGLVLLWYGLQRPEITSTVIATWSVFVLFGWRFVFRDNHETGRARALPFRCHHDSGKQLSCFSPTSEIPKVSNTNCMLNRQTFQGILCVST